MCEARWCTAGVSGRVGWAWTTSRAAAKAWPGASALWNRSCKHCWTVKLAKCVATAYVLGLVGAWIVRLWLNFWYFYFGLMTIPYNVQQYTLKLVNYFFRVWYCSCSWKKCPCGPVAVSYTHLDVYKRQEREREREREGGGREKVLICYSLFFWFVFSFIFVVSNNISIIF